MAKPHMSRKSEIIFKFLDINRDGVLTWAEMETFPKRLQSTKGKEEHGTKLAKVYKEVWERVNEAAGKEKTNESLTQAEFVTGTDIVRETPWFHETFVKDTTDVYFDSIDKNKDDKVNLAEWRAFYASRGVTDETFTKETFDKLDKDGSGEISREEFKDAIAKFSICEDVDNDFAFVYDITKIPN